MSKRSGPPERTPLPPLTSEDYKAHLASFLKRAEKLPPLAEEKYLEIAQNATTYLSTLADLLRAKITDVDFANVEKENLELRLTKGNREVVVRVEQNGAYFVTYFENGLSVGEPETRMGLRQIANWLAQQ